MNWPIAFRLLERGMLPDWLVRHGSRRLSDRSRALWEIVLGVRAAAAGRTGAEVWSAR